MEGCCSSLHPRRLQSSTIIGVRMFVVSDGLHPVPCCTRDSCPCILDLLIPCRLHQLDRCSVGAVLYGLGIGTLPPPMALQMVSWPWPPVFFLQSFLCFATMWQFFILSNLAASVCIQLPHLFHFQTEQLVRQVFCQP